MDTVIDLQNRFYEVFADTCDTKNLVIAALHELDSINEDLTLYHNQRCNADRVACSMTMTAPILRALLTVVEDRIGDLNQKANEIVNFSDSNLKGGDLNEKNNRLKR
ncbi:hypothetical protein [Lacticaseibacillus jixiensis]|uniref:hypothetical protein n=1 Tax=Lacticaseibacillus jixiensis TaxID=3231926 RepID=UPI0036F3A589